MHYLVSCKGKKTLKLLLLILRTLFLTICKKESKSPKSQSVSESSFKEWYLFLLLLGGDAAGVSICTSSGSELGSAKPLTASSPKAQGIWTLGLGLSERGPSNLGTRGRTSSSLVWSIRLCRRLINSLALGDLHLGDCMIQFPSGPSTSSLTKS